MLTLSFKSMILLVQIQKEHLELTVISSLFRSLYKKHQKSLKSLFLMFILQKSFQMIRFYVIRWLHAFNQSCKIQRSLKFFMIVAVIALLCISFWTRVQRMFSTQLLFMLSNIKLKNILVTSISFNFIYLKLFDCNQVLKRMILRY